jgi:hypothetical protein
MNRSRTLLAGLAAFAALAFAGEAHAIPSFVRITGLTCNQCHVQFTPNPDFTWTGKKFRWNGMRAPWVQQKIVAGDEGAVTGRRLSLNFVNYFSMGMQQDLLTQSKGTSNPALPPAERSPLGGNPASNLSTFYSGPIGDHIGIWNEIYWSAGGAEDDNPFRVVTWDELDLKLVWNPSGNIVGMSVHTEPLPTTFAFQFNSGAPTHVRRGGTAQSHTPNMGINAYGFWGDRLLTVIGIEAGEENNDWQAENPVTGDMERKMNFQTLVSYALMNQDAGDMWLWGFAKVGNDAIPMTTNAAVNRSTRAFSYSANIRGLTALIPTGTPYLAIHTGDTFRSQFNWEYGFIDRGKWSARTAVGFSHSKDNYTDGASIEENGIGWTTRWNYDRTWEWQLALTKRVKWAYTDVAGVSHAVPNDWSINARMHRRLAMNFVLSLVVANSQTFAIEQNWRNGYSWELSFDYYF